MTTADRFGLAFHAATWCNRDEIHIIRLGAHCFDPYRLVGCSGARSDKIPNPESHLEPNSCAINCPVNTGNKYAGLSGSASCVETHSSLCQCTDDTRPMAGCTSITPSLNKVPGEATLD